MTAETLNIVVQVNGKLRARLEVPADLPDSELRQLCAGRRERQAVCRRSRGPQGHRRTGQTRQCRGVGLSCRACCWVLVSGCGFQAQGRIEFPASLEATYVDGADRYSFFYEELLGSLRNSEVPLVDSSFGANTVIRVSRDESAQRVLSVSPRNVPREFELYYTIRYEVLVNGTQVLEPQTLTRTRDYSYDETQVLGKSLEQDMLRRALARELVELVIRRVNTIN